MGNLANYEVVEFADWAVNNDNADKKAFRVAAAVNLRAAIDARTIATPPLSSEEIEFVEGWIYLARLELGTTDPEALDQHLVAKARESLADGAVHVMNG